MTSEDDFHAALDGNPEDWQTRLVFADWLEEHGDPRADGYRALGALRLHPLKDHRPNVNHNWYYHSGGSDVMIHHSSIAQPVNLLPIDWIEAVDKRFNARGDALWVGYSTERRVVEDAIATAFGRLPAVRRAELLAANPPPAPPPANPRRTRRKA